MSIRDKDRIIVIIVIRIRFLVNIFFNKLCKLGKFWNCEISLAANDELVAHCIEEPGKITCLAVGYDIFAVKCLV